MNSAAIGRKLEQRFVDEEEHRVVVPDVDDERELRAERGHVREVLFRTDADVHAAGFGALAVSAGITYFRSEVSFESRLSLGKFSLGSDSSVTRRQYVVSARRDGISWAAAAVE